VQQSVLRALCPVDDTKSDARCRAIVGDWSKANDRYRKAVDSVYLYGTDGAYSAQHRLSRAIDFSRLIRGSNGGGIFGRGIYGYTFKFQEYRAAYSAFQTVMCREVSPTPGKRCDGPPG
jgi:hypothetical protein